MTQRVCARHCDQLPCVLLRFVLLTAPRGGTTYVALRRSTCVVWRNTLEVVKAFSFGGEMLFLVLHIIP